MNPVHQRASEQASNGHGHHQIGNGRGAQMFICSYLTCVLKLAFNKLLFPSFLPDTYPKIVPLCNYYNL